MGYHADGTVKSGLPGFLRISVLVRDYAGVILTIILVAIFTGLLDIG